MLSDDLEECKEHLTQFLDTMKTDAKRLEQIGDTLKASHRCWPSRVGWGIATGLAVYVLFMHSFHNTEHSHQTYLETALETRVTSGEHRLTQLETPPPVAVVKPPWWRRR